jgi:hypothetical protein
MNKEKKKQLLILILIIISMVSLALVTRNIPILNSTFFVTLTVLVIPALYLWKAEKKNASKLLVASLVFGVLFGSILEFIAELNQDWTVGQLILGVKILGVTPLENIIGHFGMSFLIFTFYEHFLDDEKDKKVSKKVLMPLILSIIANLSVFSLYIFQKELLILDYSYLIMGILAIIPLIYIVLRYPVLLGKLLHLALFFAILFFVLEIIGVYNGYWSFSGDTYIGVVNIGNLKFAFDDFIFWVMLYPSTIVSYYEYFVDDRK